MPILKKKGKKSKKKKEEEIFTEEEYKAYKSQKEKERRELEEAQKQEAEPESVAAAAAPKQAATNPPPQDTADQWSKFQELTAGVDDILHKTQEDLERIKGESFFQKVAPPPSEPEPEPAEPEASALEPEAVPEEEDEDNCLFDTSYLDIAPALEKEVHALTGFTVPALDDFLNDTTDDALFDTGTVNDVLGIRKICGGKFENKKRRARINLDSAVGVLKSEAPKPRRILPKEDQDLFAVDNSADLPSLVANNEGPSLLDDLLNSDDQDTQLDQVIVENIVREILLSVVSSGQKQKLDLTDVDPLLSLPKIRSTSQSNTIKELAGLFGPEEDSGDEFEQLALESAKKPAPAPVKKDDLDEEDFFAQISGIRPGIVPTEEEVEEDPFDTNIVVGLIKTDEHSGPENTSTDIDVAADEEIDPFDTGCAAEFVSQVSNETVVIKDPFETEAIVDTCCLAIKVNDVVATTPEPEIQEDQLDPFDTSVVKDLNIPSHDPVTQDPFETYSESFQIAVGLAPDALDIHVLTPITDGVEPIVPAEKVEDKSADIISILDPLEANPCVDELCKPKGISKEVLQLLQEAEKKKDPFLVGPDPFNTDVVIQDLGLPDHSSKGLDLLGESEKSIPICAPVLAPEPAEEIDPFDTTCIDY